MRFKYLIDTDWVIDYLAGIPKVVDRVLDCQKEGIALSIVSYAELYEGVLYSQNSIESAKALNSFLSAVPVLEISKPICELFGRERGLLRSKRITVADFDLLIGATALHHHLILLTNNKKHFLKISDLKIESI